MSRAPKSSLKGLSLSLTSHDTQNSFPRFFSKPEHTLFFYNLLLQFLKPNFSFLNSQFSIVHESQTSLLALRTIAHTYMDLEKEVEVINSSLEVNTGSFEEGAVLEPYVGMEFDSEDAARKFYVEYARRVGFIVRIMQRRRSGIDGRTLARRLGCNKQGFSPNHRGTIGPEKKPRPSAREGCKATILVKMEKSGKWVVSRFEKEHNHPLVVTANGFSTSGDKDKKIEELTMELERQEQLCAAYREKLLSFMNNVEDETEELSSKIQVIVDNVRKVESEVQKHSRHR